MVCPFASLIGVGAVATGSQRLLVRDYRYRVYAWVVAALLGGGWLAYFLALRRPEVRIALEVASVLALVAGALRVRSLVRSGQVAPLTAGALGIALASFAYAVRSPWVAGAKAWLLAMLAFQWLGRARFTTLEYGAAVTALLALAAVRLLRRDPRSRRRRERRGRIGRHAASLRPRRLAVARDGRVSAGPAGVAGVLPLSARLREETRERHERVEHASAINRLVVVKVPPPEAAGTAAERGLRERALADYREVYRLFLVSAHGFEAAVMERLAGSPVVEPARSSGWVDEAVPSTALIRDDLERVFGEGSSADLPAMEGLPEVRTLAEWAGMEYVRRGSRAGGAVIGAVVAHNLCLTREHGASFLLQHGKDTKRVLVAFKAWVDSLPFAAAEARDAVTAANATFLAVERWHRHLERTLIPR